MVFSSSDKRWMSRAIEIADRPKACLLPNPRVGAVLVWKDQKISEGFHRGPGKPHAEVECIRAALKNEFKDFSKATLYISLEPCVHTNKRTPPCVPLLLEKKFKRIVVAHLDPNPEVSGKGVRALKKAGLHVDLGCLKKKSLFLNQAFIKNQKTSLPYLTMKLAMTFDGAMATKTGESKWITNEVSRKEVHELRNRIQAIGVGKKTIEKDRPRLNVRLGEKAEDRSIVVFGLPKNLKAWAKKRKLPPENLLVISAKRPSLKALTWLSPGKSLRRTLGKLKKEHQIQHLLVEGGPKLASSLLEKGLVDELIIYYGNGFFGGKSPYRVGSDWSLKKIKNSVRFRSLEAIPLEGDVKVRGYLHVYGTGSKKG